MKGRCGKCIYLRDREDPENRDKPHMCARLQTEVFHGSVYPDLRSIPGCGGPYEDLLKNTGPAKKHLPS
jgi:hypothetical protein